MSKQLDDFTASCVRNTQSYIDQHVTPAMKSYDVLRHKLYEAEERCAFLGTPENIALLREADNAMKKAQRNLPPDPVFKLYIEGNRLQQWRKIKGYCIPGSTRVVLNNPLRFSVSDMTLIMLKNEFDFASLPVATGVLTWNWLMHLTDAPVNFHYMQSQSARVIEARVQAQNFLQYRKFEEMQEYTGG